MALSPPPPPPPPPPPLAIISSSVPSNADAGGIIIDSVNVTDYMCLGQMGVHMYKRQCGREVKKGNDLDTVFLSYYRNVTPILQQGPVCGLVALAMAAPLVHQAKDGFTEKLLKVAREMGYSKQGEMFSAANMSSLVQYMLPDPIRSEVIVNCDLSQILHLLLQGDLLLIPYDADKNFSPCQKKGHKAHWMLITGCFLAVDNSNKIIDMTLLEEHEDYYERNVFHLKHGKTMTTDILHTLSQNTDSIVGVLVYGQQGKSKHTGLWTIPELLASNLQLVELGANRDCENYVVPEGGLKEGLCGQIVRIFQRDQNSL